MWWWWERIGTATGFSRSLLVRLRVRFRLSLKSRKKISKNATRSYHDDTGDDDYEDHDDHDVNMVKRVRTQRKQKSGARSARLTTHSRGSLRRRLALVVCTHSCTALSNFNDWKSRARRLSDNLHTLRSYDFPCARPDADTDSPKTPQPNARRPPVSPGHTRLSSSAQRAGCPPALGSIVRCSSNSWVVVET